MKCRNCDVDVPPTFAKALVENRCPACGKEIMSGVAFREMLHIRKLLASLQLDDKLLTTIAAAVSSKFDLVPKGTKQEPAVEASEDAESESADEESEDPADNETEEERVRRRALQAAQKEREEAEEKRLIAEWGLEQGELSGAAVKSASKQPVPQEFVEMFDGEGSEFDALPAINFSSTNVQKEAERAARLAKAEAARNSGAFKVARRD